jgi:hypothetical protein
VRFFRVFPFAPDAAPKFPGGALFRPRGGSGRIDNPSLYSVLYAASEPECAIAEAFGDLAIWREEMLMRNEFRYALATLAVSGRLPLWEMDDTQHLEMLGLKPSDVVRRERTKTQAWAARVFAMKRYRGISWWSYYNPDWKVCGLWTIANVRIEAVEPLSIDSRVLRASAASIVRLIQ